MSTVFVITVEDIITAVILGGLIIGGTIYVFWPRKKRKP